MKKILLVLLASGVLFMVIFAAARSGKSLAKTPGNETTVTDEQRIANLLHDMNNVDLVNLPALPAERFALPPAGVDVMRVRLEETYDIKGVGKDTVELTGWIAAKHDNARPAVGETEVKWGTAIVDTEFVGLELRGNSKVFGPVLIHLNKSNPSLGQVGKLDLSFLERIVLDAAYRDLRPLSPTSTSTETEAAPPTPQKEMRGSAQDQRAIKAVMQGVWKAISNRDAKGLLQYYASNSRTARGGEDEVAKQFSSVRRIRVSPKNDIRIRFMGSYANVTASGVNTVVDQEGKTGTSAWKADVQLEKQGDRWVITQDRTSINAGRGSLKVPDRAGKCLAKISVDVEMPNLNITMRSKDPVKWYSEVETIPPIGYTASVSTSSTAMISGDREVASLLHGAIKFREIVQRVRLDGTNW